MTAIAIANREVILEKVSEGRRLSEIAQELGITPQAISKQLSADPEFRTAKECGAENRLESLEIKLEEIQDDSTMVSLARNKELLSHQRWRCEREFPHKWAPRNLIAIQSIPDPDAGLTASINDLLSRVVRETVPNPDPDEIAAELERDREAERDVDNSEAEGQDSPTAYN